MSEDVWAHGNTEGHTQAFMEMVFCLFVFCFFGRNRLQGQRVDKEAGDMSGVGCMI